MEVCEAGPKVTAELSLPAEVPVPSAPLWPAPHNVPPPRKSHVRLCSWVPPRLLLGCSPARPPARRLPPRAYVGPIHRGQAGRLAGPLGEQGLNRAAPNPHCSVVQFAGQRPQD
eukprot:2548101-Rhodomonas_salina.1